MTSEAPDNNVKNEKQRSCTPTVENLKLGEEDDGTGYLCGEDAAADAAQPQPGKRKHCTPENQARLSDWRRNEWTDVQQAQRGSEKKLRGAQASFQAATPE